MASKLNPKTVQETFLDCLFKEGEDTSKHVVVRGITLNVGFHPGRLETHKTTIEEMLAELPDEFQATKGGGWSFLNACNDRHGDQWTSLHRTMEQLFLLGIATGKARFQPPREMWESLPGGMPYIVVAP